MVIETGKGGPQAPIGWPGPGEMLCGALSESTDPMLLLHRLVTEVLVLIDRADGSAVEVAGEESMLYVCTAGTLQPHVRTVIPLRNSLSGLAAATGQTLRCDDAGVDDRVDRAACERVGAVSMLCVPLIRMSSCVGVLKVTSTRRNAFTDADVAVLETVAPFIATVVGAAWDISDLVEGLLVVEPDLDQTGSGPGLAVAQFLANVLHPGLLDQLEVREQIGSVLRSGRVRTVCQPIIDLTDGSLVAAEALARIEAPGGVAQAPDRWFAQAHAVGLGIELELAALRTALDLLPQLPLGIELSVNLGPAALATQAASDLIEHTGPERVVIELTEHAPVEDYPGLRQALHRLRQRGAKLAIDDTGAGISSLAHILQLAPDYIKLDRQLTAGIDHDPVRRALAQALVSFAAESGAQVIAEGIEDDAALDALEQLGIRYGQGFHIGRPEPVAALHDRLARIGVRQTGNEGPTRPPRLS